MLTFLMPRSWAHISQDRRWYPSHRLAVQDPSSELSSFSWFSTLSARYHSKSSHQSSHKPSAPLISLLHANDASSQLKFHSLTSQFCRVDSIECVTLTDSASSLPTFVGFRCGVVLLGYRLGQTSGGRKGWRDHHHHRCPGGVVVAGMLTVLRSCHLRTVTQANALILLFHPLP